MKATRLFISYSHKDEALRQELEKHLQLLRRNGYVELWHDRKLLPGDDFKNQIDVNLKSSKVILLLISSDFISSDYCYEIELRESLKLHEEKKAILVPIILRECNWHMAPFGALNALPTDGVPVVSEKWHTQDTAFTNISKSLQDLIIQFQKVSQPAVPDLSSKQGTSIDQVIEIFKQESARLNFNSTKEDFTNVDALKRELYSKLIGNLDEKIANTGSLKEKQSQILFERIYSLERIDDMTANEIQKLRSAKENYEWFDRKLIVNALTLSMINFTTFDRRKIHLLLDFLTDFEEQVWQAALTGTIIALIHHQNKWNRFDDLKKRLNTLRDLENVQEGLRVIEFILCHKLYKQSTFYTQIYSLPFFEDISNCFLPFHEKNPVIQNAFIANRSSIDPEEFINNVGNLPFLDCYKYALALSMEDGTLVKSNDRMIKAKVTQSLNISNSFNPFQNLISEYYHFFSFYPKAKVQDVFSRQMSITTTKLKNLVLEKTNELRLTAEFLIEEKSFESAAISLQNLLKIEPTNVEALTRIAHCFMLQKRDDYPKAIRYLIKASEIDDKSVEVHITLGHCYSFEREYQLALNAFLMAKKIDPRNKKLLLLLGECYKRNRQYHKALDFLAKAASLAENLKLMPIHRLYSEVYAEMSNKEESLKYSELLLKHDPKNADSHMMLGRNHLICKGDLNLARKHLLKAADLKASAIVYGNLGHLELFTGHEQEAISYYNKCADMFNRVEDFTERFDRDLIYAMRYSIAKEEYYSLRDKIVEWWRTNHKR